MSTIIKLTPCLDTLRVEKVMREHSDKVATVAILHVMELCPKARAIFGRDEVVCK